MGSGPRLLPLPQGRHTGTAPGVSVGTPSSRPLCPMPSSPPAVCPPWPRPPHDAATEPPCTDPYARWWGRGGAVRLPPIPIAFCRLSGRAKNRDREQPHGSPLPRHRAYGSRTRRFIGLCGLDHEGRQAEDGEESIGQGEMQGRSESHPPGTVTATGTSGCHVVVNAATAQLLVPLASTLPLLPGDGAQPSPDPLVQIAQLRRQFAEPKLSSPADQIACEVFGVGVQRGPAVAPGQVTDPLLEPGQRRRRDPPPRHRSDLEAEAQELPVLRLVYCALGRIHPELEPTGQEVFDACHHPFTGTAAAHIDIAVVGITREARDHVAPVPYP